jgi:hypothetical protein
MKRHSILFGALLLFLAPAASAQQMIPPGWSQFNPPLPAPLPPPRIEAPVIPRLDAPPSQPQLRPSQRGSFSDRINQCLADAAAAGLGPAERAAYSRSCANR